VRWAIGRWLKGLDDAKEATAARIVKIEERVNDQGRDIAAIKTRIEDTPSSKAMHELSVTLTDLKGEIGVASERLRGVTKLQERLEATVDRQEGWLREHGRSR